MQNQKFTTKGHKIDPISYLIISASLELSSWIHFTARYQEEKPLSTSANSASCSCPWTLNATTPRCRGRRRNPVHCSDRERENETEGLRTIKREWRRRDWRDWDRENEGEVIQIERTKERGLRTIQREWRRWDWRDWRDWRDWDREKEGENDKERMKEMGLKRFKGLKGLKIEGMNPNFQFPECW